MFGSGCERVTLSHHGGGVETARRLLQWQGVPNVGQRETILP
jgi:hypothetical protein